MSNSWGANGCPAGCLSHFLCNAPLRDRRKDLYSVSWVKKTERDDELLEQGAERVPKTSSRRKAIAAG